MKDKYWIITYGEERYSRDIFCTVIFKGQISDFILNMEKIYNKPEVKEDYYIINSQEITEEDYKKLKEIDFEED